MSNDNNGNSRDSMKLLYSRYILKIESRVFAGGMCVEQQKNGSKMTVFGLNK